LLLLGHTLLVQKKSVAAESSFRRALLIDSDDNGIAGRGLAKALLDQERYREARALLHDLLNAYPNDSELWGLSANMNIALKDNYAAIVALETAGRLGCRDSNMTALLGDLYMDANRPADAVKCYQDAVSRGWTGGAHLLRAARGFMLLGNADEAEAILKLARDDKNTREMPEYLRVRADILALRGKRDEAAAIYRTVLKKNPLDGETLLKLGDLLRESGKYVDAQLYYERAGRIDEFKAAALVKQAELLVHDGSYAKAIKLLETAQALEFNKNVERYLRQLRRFTS
jgi:tetratricopeptide (TPR) repeat protein